MSETLRFAIEALLFASEKPLSVEEIKSAFDGADSEAITASLKSLREEYQTQERGFMLVEIAGGHQLVTHPRFAEVLKKFYQSREKKKLSQGALETLSVVAYRQPVTRADIEFIRGVNVDGAIKSLTEKDLIRMVGRKEVPGRPILYGTTKNFLERFGLGSLKNLPPLSEFTEKDLDPSLVPPPLKSEPAEGVASTEDVESSENDADLTQTNESTGGSL